METFKILQITIKEGIFVVPFDFERNFAAANLPHMINFVGDRFSLHTINQFFDFKFVLMPTDFGQLATK